MRNPRDYPKAVIVGQSFVTLVYLVVAVTVYCTAGNYVASPALGTAGPLIKRVAYGLALPGVIFSAIMYTHVRPRSALSPRRRCYEENID